MTPQGFSVGLPHSSALIKFAILPKNNPGGDDTAIKSAPDQREIELKRQYKITAKQTPKNHHERPYLHPKFLVSLTD